MSQYVATLERVLLLRDRIEAIEKKQAERFPMLVERLNRIEQSIVALVDRINETNRAVSILNKDAHTHTLYGGPAVPITKEDAEGGSW